MLTLRRREGAKHQDPAAQSRVRASDRIRMVKVKAEAPAQAGHAEAEEVKS
jgi:NADH-quinone oxidoreductase subunit J